MAPSVYNQPHPRLTVSARLTPRIRGVHVPLVGIAIVVVAVVATAAYTIRERQSAAAADVDAQGLPTAQISREFVQSRAEPLLHYPGAQLFAPIGTPELIDAQSNVQSNASAGGVFITNDPPETVLGWYRTWAGYQGWRPRPIMRLSTETVAEGYEKPRREIFEVGIDNPAMLSSVLGKQVPEGGTVFEVSYTIISARNPDRYVQP